MRAIAATLLALAVGAGGCGKTRACKSGTVLVSVAGSLADGADTLSLDISVDGGTPKTVTVAWHNGGGTIEIDFPSGYPRGSTVTIAATASQAGATLATGSGSIALDDTCKTLTIGFGGSGGDLGGGDGMCEPTVTSCPATTVCGKIDDGCGNVTVDCGPCQLNGADRVVGSTGDVITLEGKFAAPTVVTFPGGTMVNATLLGDNRATVVVPATSGEGQLAVVSNHSAAMTVPFRRGTYAVELQTWRSSYEQVEHARQMPTMNDLRWWTTAVAGDRYVYVLGGPTQMSANGPTSVEQAMINGDGSIGAMRLSANRMTTFHAYAPSLRIGSHVYVFGGNDGNSGANNDTSVTNKVDVATINADGTIGVFSAATATLKATRAIGAATFNGVWGHSAAVIGNWVYIFGGSLGPFCSGMATTQIERAPINADGTIGDFAILTNALMTAETNGAALVDGGFVYVVSGTKIQFAPIMPNGDLGAFADSGVTLPADRSHAVGYVLNNMIYLIGGGAGGTVKLPVNANGTLGAAVAVPGTILGFGSNFGSAIIGHYVYAFGGGDSNACGAAFLSATRVIQRASLDGGTTLSAFTSIPAVNPTKRDGFLAISVGNNVYAIGGERPATTPDVDHAVIGADGLLGNFAGQSGSLVTRRSGLTGAVVGNFVYVLGGDDPTTMVPVGSIEVAPINADGTLGAFAVAKANGSGAALALGTPRSDAVAWVVPADHNSSNNDNLCIGGGANAGGALNSVECAIINSDGTLPGNLVGLSPAVNLLAPGRPAQPVGYVGDRVYAMAGNSGSGACESAPFDTTGKMSSTFAASVMLSNMQQDRFGWSAGSTVWIAGGDGGLGAFPKDIEASAISAAGALANFTTPPTVLQFGRSSGRALVLGTRVYIFGGFNQLGAADTESAELR